MTHPFRPHRALPLSTSLLVLLLAHAVAWGGVRSPLSGEGSLEFTADLPVFATGDGRARVDLAVRVDHPQFRFQRLRGQWLARCAVDLKLARRGQVALDTTQVFVVEARDEADAEAPLRFQLLELSADVPAGLWALTLRVSDLTSQDETGFVEELPSAVATGVLEVPRWAPGDARASDPEFRIRSGGQSLPNPSRVYGVVQDTLEVYLELADAIAGEPRQIDVEVLDPVYGGMDRQMVTLEVAESPAASLLRVPLTTFPEGRYVLRLTPQWGGREAREAEFTVSWRVARAVQARGDVAIEAMLLLAPEDFADFKRLSRPAQSQRMQEFWNRRDPTPGTVRNELHERFLERVQHAREHFGEFGTPGPLTDRGRIYVHYGAPAQVSVEVIPTNKEDLDEAIDSVHDTFNMELWGTFARDFEGKDSFVGLERRAVEDVEAAVDRRRNRQRIGQEGSFELWVYNLDGDPLFPDEVQPWTENVDLRFLFVDRLGTGVYRLNFDNVQTRY